MKRCIPGRSRESYRKFIETANGISSLLPTTNNRETATSFLETLNLDTRLKIYAHLLTSPTGVITLSPTPLELSYAESEQETVWTAEEWASDQILYGETPRKALCCKLLVESKSGNNEKISLAFLRTCRQIYAEAQDFRQLWKNNAIRIINDLDFARVPKTLKSNCRYLKLEMDFALNSSPTFAAGTEDQLQLSNAPYKSWKLEHKFTDLGSSWPNLKRLTMEAWPKNVVYHDGSVLTCHDKLVGSTYNRRAVRKGGTTRYAEDLQALKGASRDLKSVKRDILFESRWAQDWRSNGVSCALFKREYDPNALIADWAFAFGRDLMINGMLCYRDGKKVASAFFPESGDADVGKMYYRRHVDVWWWATEYYEARGGDLSEISHTIATVYENDGLEGVSRYVGREAVPADTEALRKFREDHCHNRRPATGGLAPRKKR